MFSVCSCGLLEISCVVLYGLIVFAVCVYVCLFVISAFVCIVCDLLHDVRWLACFLYWLCSCVCYLLCVLFVRVCMLVCVVA